MTIITIEKPVTMQTTHFADMNALIHYITTEYLKIDLRELDDEEVTEEMKQSVETSKRIPKHLLHNL